MTLVLMALAHLLLDMMLGFWAVYKTVAHVNLAVAGMIHGVSVMVGEGMQFVFGPLGDRGYRKFLIVVGLMMSGAATLFALTDNTWLLFLLYLVMATGSGMVHPSAAAVTSSLTQRRKGLYIAVFSSGGFLGMAISQIVFVRTYSSFPDKTYLLFVPVFLVACALAWLLGRQTHTSVTKPREVLKAYGEFFKDSGMRNLYFTAIFNQIIFWGVLFLLPDYLMAAGYPSYIALGGGHLCFVIGTVAMLIPAGSIADRFGAKSTILALSALGAVVHFSFLSMGLLSDSAVLVMLFFWGAFLGTVHPVALSLGHAMEPLRGGLVSGFLMGMVWIFSEATGPGLGGVIASAFGENGPHYALTALGICYVGVMVTTLRLPGLVAEAGLAEIGGNR